MEDYLELKDYFLSVKGKCKIGIIGATGDRRYIDIINLGRISAEIFDEIIIRFDKDSRGNSPQRLAELLMMGIRKADPTMKVSIIPDEFEAIHTAIKNAPMNSFIFHFPDNVLKTIEYIKYLQSDKPSKASTW